MTAGRTNSEDDKALGGTAEAVPFHESTRAWTLAPTFGWFASTGRGRPSSTYSAVASSSGAPWRRSNWGRFCEKAERGNTMSHPTS
jgi:hypothetical protein